MKGRRRTNRPVLAMIELEKKIALDVATAAAKPRQTLPPRWLKIPTAVSYSGISRSTLYELLNAGKIRSHRIGSARVLDRESLDDFISSQPGTDHASIQH